MGKEWRVKSWDICIHLHAMSDFGCDYEATEKAGHMVYTRARTYRAECYASKEGIKCLRNHVCLKARMRY